MIYIASPYSSGLEGPAAKRMEEKRYLEVLTFVTLLLTTSKLPVFSPIVYLHPIAVANEGKLGTDARFWAKFNTAFLRKSEAMFVLQLPGWQQSRGVKAEIAMAQLLDIPIQRYAEDFTEIQ